LKIALIILSWQVVIVGSSPDYARERIQGFEFFLSDDPIRMILP